MHQRMQWLPERHQLPAGPDHRLAQQQHLQEAAGEEEPQLHQHLPREHRDEGEVGRLWERTLTLTRVGLDGISTSPVRLTEVMNVFVASVRRFIFS